MKIKSSFGGYTFVELIIVMSIFVTLIGLVTINLTGALSKTSLNTTADILAGDFRGQQLKAMVGDTQGRSTTDVYGIHFEDDAYVLFHGSTYSAADEYNFEVALEDNLSFVGPPSDIIFSRVTGEVSSAGSVVIEDTNSSEQRTIEYNRYGVVTDITE